MALFTQNRHRGKGYYNLTYSVIVENESILIFMEVVQGALGDAIFDLDAAFDILLVGELNLG